MPWAYTRRVIAERWHIPPPDVDRYPWPEILCELRILNLEARVDEWKQQHGR